MANKVEVVVGTYEEYVLGYKVRHNPENGKETLVQSFADRSHLSSIRCVAVSGKYLASGGADDRIFIYDMETRKLVQTLLHHESTINTIEFTPDATHILSGGDDGIMSAIRTNTWQTEAVWKKAHSGKAVTNICCHPSGKLALSLGNDLTLRTWNLIKGRLAYTTNLKTKSHLGNTPGNIFWSPCGKYFTLTGQRIVEIWKIETASMHRDFVCEAKPTSLCWVTESELIVGLENGKVMLLSVELNESPVIFIAHKQRVKAMAYLNEVLATTSSSGDVTLWSINLGDKKIDVICSLNIWCRPTCIALIDLTQFDDDYILKREDEKKIEEVERVPSDRKKSVECSQSVIIEYELEDDIPKTIIPTARKTNEQLPRNKNDDILKSKSPARKANEQLPRNNEKIASPMIKKTKKVIEKKGFKTYANMWVNMPIMHRPHKEDAEISDHNSDWTESMSSNKESLISQTASHFLQKSTMNKTDETNKNEVIIIEDDDRTDKTDISNQKLQLKNKSLEFQCKELSVELKRKKPGRKKKEILTTPQDIKDQENDIESSIVVVIPHVELGLSQGNREITTEDTNQIDDNMSVPPKKHKKNNSPRKGPVLRRQSKKSF